MKAIMKIAAVAVLVALGCTGAFAGTKQTVDFAVFRNVTVGNTELKAGEYQAAVEVSGADAKVTILKYGKALATATGKYTEEKKLGFGFAVITEGKSVTQLQGDKLKGKIEFVAQ